MVNGYRLVVNGYRLVVLNTNNFMINICFFKQLTKKNQLLTTNR